MIFIPQLLSFQLIYDMYIYIHTMLGIAKIAVNGCVRQDNLMTHLSSGPVASMTPDQTSSSC